MASPGFHSPCCRLCSISPLICWYSGLKAGVTVAALPLAGGVPSVLGGSRDDMVVLAVPVGEGVSSR
jgi:hypothetical protein